MIISGFRKWEREIAQAKWIHAVLLVWSLQEVEQAEAEDERRLLEEEAGRLERRLDRSRNPIAAAPSINFSDTLYWGVIQTFDISLRFKENDVNARATEFDRHRVDEEKT